MTWAGCLSAEQVLPNGHVNANVPSIFAKRWRRLGESIVTFAAAARNNRTARLPVHEECFRAAPHDCHGPREPPARHDPGVAFVFRALSSLLRATLFENMQLIRALSFLSLAFFVSALSSSPAGAITVGPGGKYSTLSAAVKDTSSSVYFVFSGTYTDTVVITRPNIKIFGQTNIANSYTGNTVTITNNIPASIAGSNDASGTVQVHATNVSLYNLNIANTYGKPVVQAQAIALSVQDGLFGGYGLKITGDQDTLLANVGTIWITNSVINTIGSGCITASGRSSADAFWYVIDHSTVQGTGTAYLGRPWRDFARVVFQHSTLGSNVPAAGWSVWNSTDPQTDHVTFAEYENSGPGAAGVRANFSTRLSAPVSIFTVLNSTSWIDRAFL
ncbi:Pectinesterase [Grifola frondosa]|uniref:pectinesterase n=1 Tax=Grifola frondosa TaxID=5627 RepID=A0A1C7MPS5_GRIFR|nr:Pectinesterase [Grifola frondosa]